MKSECLRVKQGMNEWMNKWMNGWMNEYMNKWIYEQMNEWVKRTAYKRAKLDAKIIKKNCVMDGSMEVIWLFFNYLRAPGAQEPLTIILVLVCRMTVSWQPSYSFDNNEAEKMTINSWF